MLNLFALGSTFVPTLTGTVSASATSYPASAYLHRCLAVTTRLIDPNTKPTIPGGKTFLEFGCRTQSFASFYFTGVFLEAYIAAKNLTLLLVSDCKVLVTFSAYLFKRSKEVFIPRGASKTALSEFFHNFRVMHPCVLSSTSAKFKILNSIVRPIPIFMMNLLSWG